MSFRNTTEIIEFASNESGVDQEDTLWRVYEYEPHPEILRLYTLMCGNVEYTKRLVEVMPHMAKTLLEQLVYENTKLANKIMELQKGLK